MWHRCGSREGVSRQFTNSCCSSWRHPRRKSTEARSQEFLQPAPRTSGGRSCRVRTCWRLTNLIHELANQKPECAYGARMGNDLAMPLRDDELSAGWGEGGI